MVDALVDVRRARNAIKIWFASMEFEYGCFACLYAARAFSLSLRIDSFSSSVVADAVVSTYKQQ